jgi:hypothetical protein
MGKTLSTLPFSDKMDGSEKDGMLPTNTIMKAVNVRQKMGIVKTLRLRKTKGMAHRTRMVRLNKR